MRPSPDYVLLLRAGLGSRGRAALACGGFCDITVVMLRGGARRGKTNFFERRVGEYQKSSVMAGLNKGASQHTFATDVDF